MKQLHLKCMVRIKKYKSYRGEVGKIAPIILKRNLKAEKLMKNGLLMLQSSPYLVRKSTWPLFLICLTVRLLVTTYQIGPLFLKQ